MKKNTVFSYFPLDNTYLKERFLASNFETMGIFTSCLPWYFLGAVSVHRKGKSRAIFLNPLLRIFPLSLLKKHTIRHEQIHLYRQGILGGTFFEENLVRYLMCCSKPFFKYLSAIASLFTFLGYGGLWLFVAQGAVFWILHLFFIIALFYGYFFFKLHGVMTKLRCCVGKSDSVFALMLRLKEEEVVLFSSLSSHQVLKVVENWKCHHPRWRALGFLLKESSLAGVA